MQAAQVSAHPAHVRLLGADVDRRNTGVRKDGLTQLTGGGEIGSQAVTFRRVGFLVRGCLCFASSFKTSSFDTLSTERTALSKRCHSVLPGTLGGGSGFMVDPS